MNNFLSNKIRNINFILIIMIVFLHAYNLPKGYPENSILYVIEQFFTNGVARVAVPLFFIISGYLFFINISKFTIGIYMKKIKKRLNSLVIPFLVWSLISVILVTNVSLFGYNFGRINIQSISDFFNILIIKPIPFQLWFIRDLFIIILLSPLLYIILKKISFIYLPALFIIWFINAQIFKIVDNETVFFFSLGSFFALNKFHFILVKHTGKRILYVLFGLWFLLLLLRLFDGFIIRDLFLYRAAQLLGILFLWLAYDYYSTKNIIFINSFIKKNRGYAFFVFLLHEPLLSIIKATIPIEALNSWYLLTYFGYPILTVFICLTVGKFLKSNFIVYNFLTGNRK